MADEEQRRVPRRRRAVAMVAEAPAVRAESAGCAACEAKDARIAELEAQVRSLLHHVERRG